MFRQVALVGVLAWGLVMSARAQSTGERVQGILGKIKTGQTKVYADYDDAWYAQRGNGLARSFSDAGPNVTRDNNTGLEWVKDPSRIGAPFGSPGEPALLPTWQAAFDACRTLNYNGHSDWRMPTLMELMTLCNIGMLMELMTLCNIGMLELRNETDTQPYVTPPLESVFATNWDGNNSYISATAVNWGQADSRHYQLNYLEFFDQLDNSGSYVRPVRGGADTTVTRFVLSDSGKTVTDQASGLMWVRDPYDAEVEKAYKWVAAIHACRDLEYAGHNDWRLPNLNELLSLLDNSKTDPASNEIFLFQTMNVGQAPWEKELWTSSSSEINPDAAFTVRFRLGRPGGQLTANARNVGIRPVRSIAGNVAAGWQRYE